MHFGAFACTLAPDSSVPSPQTDLHLHHIIPATRQVDPFMAFVPRAKRSDRRSASAQTTEHSKLSGKLTEGLSMRQSLRRSGTGHANFGLHRDSRFPVTESEPVSVSTIWKLPPSTAGADRTLCGVARHLVVAIQDTPHRPNSELWATVPWRESGSPARVIPGCSGWKPW